MISELKDFGIKKWILSLVALLILTDLVVLLNVPYLREIMVFISFSTIPGLLILHLLRLNTLDFIKKVVLTIGLSISFIMFSGLVLNSLYPIILKPLSLIPVLVFFNVILIILALGAYRRNKDFVLGEFLNFKIDLQGKLTSTLIFPILFPFMAIFGTYLMNITQNNIILLAMLLLIPVYLVVLVVLKDRIHNFTYPLTLGMIGLALLLMYGLTSFHLMGRDVQFEFHFFNFALNNFHWSPIGDIPQFNAYNSCLSVTILPAIFKILSNMNSEYIFKLYYALIGTILPLILYTIFRRYFSRQNAFFGALIFIFQPYFIYFLGIVRQEIAFLFFLLAILVYFDDNISKNIKKILFLVLMFSVIISHYATAYVSFLIIMPILLVPFIRSLIKDWKHPKFTNFDIIVSILIFMFLWYILVAGSQFAAASDTINLSSTALASGHSGIGGEKDTKVLAIFGIGLKSIPNAISAIVNDIIILIMGLGLLNVIRKYSFWKKRIKISFIWGMILSPLILVLPLVLPSLSIVYDIQRLFLQLVVFLAPLFIIGIYYIVTKIKKPHLKPVLLLVMIIALFSCSTYLTYHFAGIPYSPYYETNGSLRDEHIIYDQEINAAKWINVNSLNNTNIITDGIAFSRLMIANNSFSVINTKNLNPNYYIYLGYANIKEGIIYTKPEFPERIETFPNLVFQKNKIFDNGASQIFYGPTTTNN